MIQDIEQIEYRGGMLANAADPGSLAARIWRGAKIPQEVRKAIIYEDLLNLGGVYGDKEAGDPLEYDHLRIVLTEDVVSIEVFNRGIEVLTGNDERIRRIHRVLCKLNKGQMAVPGVFTPQQRAGNDPRLPVPPDAKFTVRDQANVLTLLAFRNGPIEDLHAGKYSSLLEDSKLSRITDEEMKTIMIAASAKLAELLALRDQDPDGFAQLLAGNWRQVRNWER